MNSTRKKDKAFWRIKQQRKEEKESKNIHYILDNITKSFRHKYIIWNNKNVKNKTFI